MVTIHPNIVHAGPEEHLLNLRKAKESISIPLIASLNAVNADTWIQYARLIGETGVDGIELNFYQIPSDFDKGAREIEDEQINIVKEVIRNVSIPVSIKLSPDYTNILNLIRKLDQAGASGFVLFNSFFQPDINVNTEKHIKSFNLSNEGDYKKSLRYSGLLYQNIKADICSSHGVFRGADIIKLILSGSSCVQVVSILYKSGFSQIRKMKKDMSNWMEMKNYDSITEFQGALSRNNLRSNPFIYKRAQYVDLLLNSEELFGIPY
jgi:dihydroorotate dehydrogenase (fumarate)